MKVLIIDPQFFMRAGLIQILTNYANQPSIYEAESFEIAENYLSADDYDLIFLEMDLPDAEIRPALQRLKKSGSTYAHCAVYAPALNFGSSPGTGCRSA